MKDKSKSFSLNGLDMQKWGKDLALFALIPLSFYITAILGEINSPNHVLAVKDFIPTNTTVISIVVYVLNSMLSLLKKYIQ